MHGDIVPTHWQIMLRDLRKEAGLSMRELSVRTSMPQRTIAEYENVKVPRHLSIYKVEKILNTLGYEIDFFLKSGGPRVIQNHSSYV
jgi:transcriptional regulator with XRE-family HTH domain|tara:strand:+ start:4749 stop:5009 length:261 start_codon:yes stop_codon:yes gene_type:complete